MATTGRNLPPPQSPFVDKQGNLSHDGYQYLLSALNSSAQAASPASVATGLVATGTNQATALQLSADWNEVDTVAANTGVLLQALQPGQSQTVFNAGANSLSIYPPPGVAIDALGVNAPYPMAAGGRNFFYSISATQIRS